MGKFRIKGTMMRFNLGNTKIWNYTKNVARLLIALLRSIKVVGIRRTALLSVKALRILGPRKLTKLLRTSLANRGLILASIKTTISDLRDKEMEIWFVSDSLDELKRIDSVDSFACLLPFMISGDNPTLVITINQKDVLEIGVRNARIDVEISDIDRFADADIDIPFSESWPVCRDLLTKGKSFRDHILRINPDSSYVPVIRGFLGLANDLGVRSFRLSSYSARARKDELVAVGDFSDAGIIVDIRKIPPFSAAPLSRYLGPPLSIVVKASRAAGIYEDEGLATDAVNSDTTTGLDLLLILSSTPLVAEKLYQRTGFNISLRVSDIIEMNAREVVASG
jgi:hypothetical protein